MSWTKYKTPGVIVGGLNVDEASCVLSVFTRDFGLIRAKVQGVRKLNSKLRPHVQSLSFSDLVIIKGKNGWKIIEAQKLKNLQRAFVSSEYKLKTSVRILHLLKRMLPEEEGNPLLFDIIINGFNFMESKTIKDVSDLEVLMVFRALRNLGYVKEVESVESLLKSSNYNEELLSDIRKNKTSIVKEINQSIKESGL